MDTAKAANLYACYPDNELLDFVLPPVGKGLLIKKTLKPLICGKATRAEGPLSFHHSFPAYYLPFPPPSLPPSLPLVPTTAGTGSESTGVFVFDSKSLKSKIGDLTHHPLASSVYTVAPPSSLPPSLLPFRHPW